MEFQANFLENNAHFLKDTFNYFQITDKHRNIK